MGGGGRETEGTTTAEMKAGLGRVTTANEAVGLPTESAERRSGPLWIRVAEAGIGSEGVLSGWIRKDGNDFGQA